MDCQAVALELGTTYQKALAMMQLPGFPAIKIGKQLHTTRELLNSWIVKHSGESFSYKCKPEQRERKTLRHQNRRITSLKLLTKDDCRRLAE